MADFSATSLARAVRWDTVVGALLVVVLLFSFGFADGFGNSLNLSFLIGNTLPIALIALPMTLLVVSGEIDLSVASTAGLSGAVMGALWNQGMAIETIIPLCLVLGAVCGLANGLLVTRLGLRPSPSPSARSPPTGASRRSSSAPTR